MKEKMPLNAEQFGESEELRAMIDAELSAMRKRAEEAEKNDEAAMNFKSEEAEREYAKKQVLQRIASKKDITSLESGD